MSLRQIVAARSAAVGDATNTYQQAFLTVNQALVAIAASPLPVLQSPPPQWPKMTDLYVQIQAIAAEWLGTLSAFCESVPSEITASATLISSALQTAQQNAAVLAADPQDQTARNTLSTALNVLSLQLGLLNTAVQSTTQDILSFQNNVPGLTDSLQTLVNDFATAVSADQAVVTALTADIAQLKQDIGTLQDQIADATDFSEITLWMSRFVPCLNGPLIGLKMTLIALSAYSEYYVDLSTNQIQADEQAITNDTAGINSATVDVAACQTLINVCQVFANQVTAFNACLSEVVTAWQGLTQDAVAAVADIEAAIDQADAQVYTALSSELSAVAVVWGLLSSNASGLVLSIQVSNAALQSGMTSVQVQQALATSGGMSVVEFVTSNIG